MVSYRHPWRRYLAESDGELLLVRKLYTVAAWSREAVEVQVELLALSSSSAGERKPKWVAVEETTGRAVFVGSVAAAAGLRESYVYLARREVELLAPHAICKYSLADDDIRGVSIYGGHSADVEPVWIAPVV